MCVCATAVSDLAEHQDSRELFRWKSLSGFLMVWCQSADEGLSERDILLDVDDSPVGVPSSLPAPVC